MFLLTGLKQLSLNSLPVLSFMWHLQAKSCKTHSTGSDRLSRAASRTAYTPQVQVKSRVSAVQVKVESCVILASLKSVNLWVESRSLLLKEPDNTASDFRDKPHQTVKQFVWLSAEKVYLNILYFYKKEIKDSWTLNSRKWRRRCHHNTQLGFYKYKWNKSVNNKHYQGN